MKKKAKRAASALAEGSGAREYEWYASWYDVQLGEEGAEVGQSAGDSSASLQASYEEALAESAKDPDAAAQAEYFAVEIAAKAFAEQFEDRVRLVQGHWTVESLALFKKFLAVLRTAERTALSKTPWPEWAMIAKAEGWKPPKGWKPGKT